MKKILASNKIKNVIKTALPTMENWFTDRHDFDIEGFSEFFNIDNDMIDYILNMEEDFSKINKKKYKNYVLQGYAEYYLHFVMSILKNQEYNYKYLIKTIKKFLSLLRDSISARCISSSNNLNYYDEFNSDNGIKDLSEYISNNVLDTMEIEKILEDNLDILTCDHFSSPCMLENEYNFKSLSENLQRFFPFSESFIRNHYEIFTVEELSENPKIKDNLEIQKILFKEILENDLNNHLKYYSKGLSNHKFTISDELRDEMVLKFNI